MLKSDFYVHAQALSPHMVKYLRFMSVEYCYCFPRYTFAENYFTKYYKILYALKKCFSGDIINLVDCKVKWQ